MIPYTSFGAGYRPEYRKQRIRTQEGANPICDRAGARVAGREWYTSKPWISRILHSTTGLITSIDRASHGRGVYGPRRLPSPSEKSLNGDGYLSDPQLDSDALSQTQARDFPRIQQYYEKMRQVNLRVYQDKEDDVEEVLEDHELDYLAIRDEGDEDEDSGTLFMFPIPSQAVTDIFHDLTDVGVSEDAYTVFANASHAETPNFDEIQQEYSTKVRGLSRRELHSKVQQMSWPPITYYVGTILSVLIATSGLLMDSPALVIGSMVVAPQVSSALTMTAGVYHADWGMFVGSAKRQSVGLASAVLGAAVFAWLAQVGGLIPTSMSVGAIELMGVRLAPTALSSLAALGAGAVGAFGYTTDQSMSLVGVMIAAAIIPAAAAVGIAVAWGSWLIALGALVLLVVNMLAINIGAVGTLLLMGYRPVWFDHTTLRSSLPEDNLATISVVALLFVLATVVTGALVGTHIGYEHGVNEAVDDTFTDPAYEDLRVKSVQSQYGGWLGTPPNVSVTVIRATDKNYSGLPNTLERRVEQQTGQDVRLTVQYTESRAGKVSAVQSGLAPARLPDRGRESPA